MATLARSPSSINNFPNSTEIKTELAHQPPSRRHRGPVAAAQAKTHLLALIDQVDSDRTSIVITKRGRAVARLVPFEQTPQPDIFGCMKGTGRITGDIVGPEPDVWKAMSE